jgi:hypothetical protein
MSEVATIASSTPPTPPNAASTTLSVRTCRLSRAPVAPRALRTASSRLREDPRARRRFATLAQAMRRTSATAPSRIRRGARTSPTIVSCSGSVNAVKFASPNSSTRRAMIPTISALACVCDTPGRSRPTTESQSDCSDASSSSHPGLSGARGIQKAAPSGYAKPCGITPITSRGRSLMSTVRPRIPGSLPNRVLQRACESTTT